MNKILLTLTLLLVNVYSQDQCSPAEYQNCGNAVKTLGYARACNEKYECRDCIGCNQACGFYPCNPSVTCSASEYSGAGNYISQNANKLGWLNLCCESSSPAYKKCVGCQQANIFNILCGWVYPPLKSAMGFSAQSPVKTMDNNLLLNNNNNNNNDFVKFGFIIYFVGLLSGLILLSSIIGISYCFCYKNNKVYNKVNAYDSE